MYYIRTMIPYHTEIAEKKRRVLELRAQGYSINQIRQLVGYRSKNSIYRILSMAEKEKGGAMWEKVGQE